MRVNSKLVRRNHMPRRRSAAEAAALIAAAHTAPRRKRERPEALIQASIVAALKRAGFAVYSTSQGYRDAPGGTRCTPGLPDLYAVCPKAGLAIWVEVKVPGGRIRGEQSRFLELHEDGNGNIPSADLWYSLDECHDYLQSMELMVQRDDGAWRFPYA